MIFDKVRKTCGFYVSDWHFVTMILPHLVAKIENGVKIGTLLNMDIKNELKEIISRLNINEITKARILQINWKSMGDSNYEDMEKYLDKIINNNDVEIIINGTKEEIETTNKMVEKYITDNYEKIKEINIINCYEVSEFNNNLNDILNEHEYIINTSGEYPVEEMFESRKKRAV